MNFANFFFRQKQKVKYHTSTDAVKKRIAEINRFGELIEVNTDNFNIKSLNFKLPRKGFEYVFNESSFELFVNNAMNLAGTYSLEEGRLIFKFDQFKIVIASGSELFIINEIFVNRCYNFRLPGGNSIVVVDMGMNVGLASLFFASHPQVELVFAYEPFLPTVKMAKNNFALNPKLGEKIKAHSYGLGNKNELIKVKYDSSNSGINSTLIESPKVSGGVEEDLEIRQAFGELQKLIEEHPGKEFVVKIDTEGAEYAIFDSIFSAELNKSIVGFFIEWHFKGPTLLESQLLKEGFKIISFNLAKDVGLIYAFR